MGRNGRPIAYVNGKFIFPAWEEPVNKVVTFTEAKEKQKKQEPKRKGKTQKSRSIRLRTQLKQKRAARDRAFTNSRKGLSNYEY